VPDHQQAAKDNPTKSPQKIIQKPVQDDQFAPEMVAPTVQQDMLSSRMMPPAQLLYLQRTIGNAAVQRLLAGNKSPAPVQKAVASPVVQRQVSPAPEIRKHPKITARIVERVLQRKGDGVLIQRQLWANSATKFQTANDLGAANSEYDVTSGGYRRFAPVNILRKIYDQVYFSKANRSFLYLTGMSDDLNTPEYDALFEKPQVESIVGTTVNLVSKTKQESPPVIASTKPSEGALVYDCNVDDSGVVAPGMHVGHHVTALGKALPTLDSPETLEAEMKKVAAAKAGAKPT
jgi:hypothetical protein